MIFNWSENCKTVLAKKQYTDNDAYDHKTIHKQESFLIKYLFCAGKNYQQVYNIWLTIKGGTADLFRHDEEQCKSEFQFLVNSARKIPEKSFTLGKPTIRVYQSEINHLNKLDAPLWVRKYWLGFLLWYKYVSLQYNVVSSSVSVEGWIFRQIDSEHEFRYKHAEINKWSRKNNNPFKKNVGQGGTYVSVDWVGPTENIDRVIGIYHDPSEFIKFFQFLKEGTHICPICGSEFDFNSKTKREICQKCWEQKERDRKRQYQAKLRSKK